MITGYVADTLPGKDHIKKPGAMLIQDAQSYIPFSNILEHGDIVLLLTPVVFPVDQGSTQDPFETLGRGLARYHPWIRHVPYTVAGGITSTHVAFIKRAKIVVFVITGPPTSGQPSQVELSSIAHAAGGRRPHVVVACCDVRELGSVASISPTVVQLPGYSRHDLEIGADILYHGQPRHSAPPPEIPSGQPKDLVRRWVVKPFNVATDTEAVYDLWRQNMPKQFLLPRHRLMNLLQRDGYAKHLVARGSETGPILGFCATYITYMDSKGEVLVGSIAAIVVDASHRGQGIGRILHDTGLRDFSRTRGVSRHQLGSTFPRLLYGVPVDDPSEGWFRRRGWNLDCTAAGTGQQVVDWLLSFNEWPTGGFPPIGVIFRPCGFEDFDRVLDIVEHDSQQKGNMAWYDHYAKLAESMDMSDILLGLRGDDIVATAITYVMRSDNPCADDIPWAGTISEDTGGATCICITGTFLRLAGLARATGS
jgi:ribosomal protein S18 acetylase RimI-like enzyme